MRIFDFLLLSFFMGCGNIFDVKDTPSNELFNLEVTHDISRIVQHGFVDLKWDEIIVENFEGYFIERQKKGQNTWEAVETIANRVVTTFQDTIFDDEDLKYRVGIKDISGNTRWAEDDIIIPKTTHLLVPIERETLESAQNDLLIDTGDTVLVEPGVYRQNLKILQKDIVIKSTTGFEKTTLAPDSTNPFSVVVMDRGVLEGFKVSHGFEYHLGGGLKVSGSAVVKQCLITDNSAETGGGGVYLTGYGTLLNCIIYDNSGEKGTNLYVNNARGKIVNCVFTSLSFESNPSVYIRGNSSGLLMLNNIIYQLPGSKNIQGYDDNSFDGIVIDYSLVTPPFMDNENGLNSGDPLFKGYVGFSEVYDFRLEESSPCKNAGHPDQEYNNKDGSRNTMGAYGGPWGE